jgi:hypothetical protein
MAFLEHHPLHVRRKIALLITGGVAVVLLVVMIFVYTRVTTEQRDNSTTTKWGQFYATVLESAQSYVGKKDGILSK